MTDEEKEDFIAINFSEYCESIKEEQDLRKVTKLLCIILTALDEIENMCSQSLLILVYITIMLRFWIFFEFFLVTSH